MKNARITLQFFYQLRREGKAGICWLFFVSYSLRSHEKKLTVSSSFFFRKQSEFQTVNITSSSSSILKQKLLLSYFKDSKYLLSGISLQIGNQSEQKCAFSVLSKIPTRKVEVLCFTYIFAFVTKQLQATSHSETS